MNVLGIDIGGSGIKGAPVDIEAGGLVDERYRVDTPRPATPDAVVAALGEVAAHWKGKDPIGVTFPGVVRSGVIGTAANLHPDWVGRDAAALFADRTGRRATVLNDADAGTRSTPLSGQSAPAATSAAPSCWSRSARASAPRSSSTGGWSPTPSSATSS